MFHRLKVCIALYSYYFLSFFKFNMKKKDLFIVGHTRAGSKIVVWSMSPHRQRAYLYGCLELRVCGLGVVLRIFFHFSLLYLRTRIRIFNFLIEFYFLWTNLFILFRQSWSCIRNKIIFKPIATRCCLWTDYIEDCI